MRGRKTTKHKLQKIWRSVKFCKNLGKRAHPEDGEGKSIISHDFAENSMKTKKHFSRMCTDRAVTRMSSGRVALRRTVDRQTPVKTLPSLAVGNERNCIPRTSLDPPLVSDALLEKVSYCIGDCKGTVRILSPGPIFSSIPCTSFQAIIGKQVWMM